MFHILISRYILLENKIYVKFQHEKLYKLQTKFYLNNIDLVLGKKQNSVRPIFARRKPTAQNLKFFSTRELQEYNKLFFVNCGAFQAVSCGIL